MTRKKSHAKCNCHYHYLMPTEMAPMGFTYGMNPMSEMPAMYDSGYPMPGYMYDYSCPMPDYMYGSHYGSHLDGNPDGAFAGAGAFAGGPFFSPFFSPFFFPFFFRRRFFPFFPFFFF